LFRLNTFRPLREGLSTTTTRATTPSSTSGSPSTRAPCSSSGTTSPTQQPGARALEAGAPRVLLPDGHQV